MILTNTSALAPHFGQNKVPQNYYFSLQRISSDAEMLGLSKDSGETLLSCRLCSERILDPSCRNNRHFLLEQQKVRTIYDRTDPPRLGIDHVIWNEAVIGKPPDADMATKATQMAKSKIRSNVAASCISRSIVINDTLVPLTTNHYRGAFFTG